MHMNDEELIFDELKDFGLHYQVNPVALFKYNIGYASFMRNERIFWHMAI